MKFKVFLVGMILGWMISIFIQYIMLFSGKCDRVMILLRFSFFTLEFCVFLLAYVTT